MNHACEQGSIPQEWTHATVTFIQNPGKPLIIENLRPISLTSCGGNGRKLSGADSKTSSKRHDITLWTPKQDSLGKLQDSLKEAANIIAKHVHTMGLRCAPQKTEPVLIKRGISQDPTVQQVYLPIGGQ
ncbi:hypothetical protein HPB47_020783 [Ixodes persulcatus]|uniref:Uncharacterized protein n=1 Tax=Ixodes persulcatus TaxID=34615 RepID=A0AC60QEC9_IXOPE|nr:hypothetical protein HPB47_020783 [Ixodes persulcatus]